ncbi:unnamed protein product [Trichobilharzia regenti]|nr:unnamed protein product [Trichobilharzia regenti]
MFLIILFTSNPKKSSPIIADYKTVSQVTDYIRTLTCITPDVGIICGSGLGKLVDDLQEVETIPYKEIPNFPQTSGRLYPTFVIFLPLVEGHVGNLVFGRLSGCRVVVMQGRFHMYEGYTNHEIALPVRVLKLLGVKVLITTNLAGGINRKYKAGDFVILKGHVNFPGLGLNNVLVGPNQNEFGPRFPELSKAYTHHLRQLALDIAREKNFHELVHEGVFAFNGGPTYETPDECNMLLRIGCDVVGMSTVPEVIVACHCGIKVLSISLIANNSILDSENDSSINHEEVLAIAAKRADLLREWIKEIVARIEF